MLDPWLPARSRPPVPIPCRDHECRVLHQILPRTLASSFVFVAPSRLGKELLQLVQIYSVSWMWRARSCSGRIAQTLSFSGWPFQGKSSPSSHRRVPLVNIRAIPATQESKPDWAANQLSSEGPVPTESRACNRCRRISPGFSQWAPTLMMPSSSLAERCLNWFDEARRCTSWYARMKQGRPGRWLDAAEVRRDEQASAARILGLADVIDFGLADGELEADEKLRKALVREIRRIRPEVVLAHDPRTWWTSMGDRVELGHSDHRAAGQALLDAIYPRAASPNSLPGDGPGPVVPAGGLAVRHGETGPGAGCNGGLAQEVGGASSPRQPRERGGGLYHTSARTRAAVSTRRATSRGLRATENLVGQAELASSSSYDLSLYVFR